MNAPKLGSGGRFRELTAEIGKEKGVHDPAAIAAYEGMKKYGKKKMEKWARAGKKRAEKHDDGSDVDHD